jgi:hypothetical protein
LTERKKERKIVLLNISMLIKFSEAQKSKKPGNNFDLQ